jgi:hypothetical protein
MAVEQAGAQWDEALVEWKTTAGGLRQPSGVAEVYTRTLAPAGGAWHAQLGLQMLELEIARAGLERMRTLSLQATEQLSSTLLTAPFSGIIISVEKRPGDPIGSYESIGAMADPSELWILATVLEDDIGRVNAGQNVTVQLDAYLDEEYAGAVLQVASQATIWQGKSAYEVTIAFDAGQDIPATIRMGADVILAGPPRENVLLVPARAIMTIAGRQYVELVGENGDAERVEIQTGVSDGENTEVVSGLQEGQAIRIP